MEIRDDDRRCDGLLAEHGRIAAQLGLAVAWTSGIRGEKAKRASDSGGGAWKGAAPLGDAEFAAGLFAVRCRTRNPVCVASRSGLLLLEVDGPDELLDGLGLPETLSGRSRRGLHRYYRPADGRAPAKVQIDESGVTWTTDGYLVMPPALHPSGHVYEWIDAGVAVATLPSEVYDELRARAGSDSARAKTELAAGKKVSVGRRHNAIFSEALAAARRGLGEAEILPLAIAMNENRCDQPLDESDVKAQVRGALRFAARRPSPQADLEVRAEQLLAESMHNRSALAHSSSCDVLGGLIEPITVATLRELLQATRERYAAPTGEPAITRAQAVLLAASIVMGAPLQAGSDPDHAAILLRAERLLLGGAAVRVALARARDDFNHHAKGAPR